MRHLDRIRRAVPPGVRRDQLRQRLAASRWLRWAPPHHLKDLEGSPTRLAATVALTYDDGPDPEITPQVLAVLMRHEVRATFFMCGLAAARHPDVVRAIVDRGHTIGAHGWDHRPLVGLPDAELRRQIDRPLEVLGDLAGGPVRWFRPPWGGAERDTVTALRTRGVTTMLWSAEGLDWKLTDAGAIVEQAEDGLDSDGGVVLLHDAVGDLLREGGRLPPDAHADRRPTVAATEMLIRRLRDRGTRLVGLDDLGDVSAPIRPTLRRPRT